MFGSGMFKVGDKVKFFHNKKWTKGKIHRILGDETVGVFYAIWVESEINVSVVVIKQKDVRHDN